MTISRNIIMTTSLKLTISIQHLNHESQVIIQTAVCTRSKLKIGLIINLSLKLCLSVVVYASRKSRSTYDSLPRINISLWNHHYLHRTIDSGSRIPTATLFKIHKIHSYFIITFLHKLSDIKSESIVSIRPVTSLLPVDIYGRLRHCTIKLDETTPCICHLFLADIESSAIVSLTYPRKSTRASTFLCCLLFTILLDTHHLKVPFLVKWS